jgi:pimeloyl-ACP methyl ester carboxylesterase
MDAPVRAQVGRVSRGAGLALLALVIAGCTASASPARSGGSPSASSASATSTNTSTLAVATPYGRQLGGHQMQPCAFDGTSAAWCGTLRVPEDRSHPSGRQIDLKVVVVPALAEVARPDAFFALDGGPGGAATQNFKWLPSVFWAIHATNDIVLVDQRGTGGSNELTLPPMRNTSGLTPAQADAQIADWMHAALASVNADPRFYTTSVAADDLDAVRAALGYDKIDLYGPSYGGTAVQYYLRQYPENVRVAVLDGATPLDVPLLERLAPNSQHALDLVVARCAADSLCHAAYPDLAAELKTVLTRLETPITVTDPASGLTATIDKTAVAPGIHQALLSASSSSVLPMAIHLAWEGKWMEVASAMTAPSGNDKMLLMSEEIRCSEDWAAFDPAQVAGQGVGSYAVEWETSVAQAQAAICRDLPLGVVPANDAAPVRSNLPVLWVVGDTDPQDPPANLSAVPSQLPNSAIVVVPGQGHTVGHLGCMPSIIGAFVDAGTVKGLDTSCVADGLVAIPAFRLP